MSDYKRWISYIYFYENNIKKNNIGYIRVETRGGNTKLTMHINVLSVTEPMNVYLFVRNGSAIEGINIGKISMDKGVGHGVYNTETNNIMDTGHSISDIGGVILFHEKEKFYASEWDDSSIDINSFVEYGEEPKTVPADEDTGQDITVHQSRDMDEAREDEKEQRSRTYGIEEGLDNGATENTAMNAQNIENATFENKNNLNMQISENQNKNTKDLNVGKKNTDDKYIDSKFAEDGNVKDRNMKENNMENINNETQDDNLIESMENKTDGNELKQTVQDVGGLSDEIVVAAENMLHTFPYMYPFENDDIDACVRIEPQDIVNLPIDTWLITNNSFLLKGYYGYRHLIFIKVGKDSPKYMIGVPGINHNRENFLANMFGFKLFKPIKNTSDIRGEFGYWCIPISGS